MSKKNLQMFCISLSLLLLPLFALPLACEAAEAPQPITISAQELTTLEVELQRAQKAIQNCKSNSAELQNQLTASKEALAEARLQLQTLRRQLEASQITLTQQKQQLQTANESLSELSRAMKAREQTLERQRNIAYIVAAGLLYAAVK